MRLRLYTVIIRCACMALGVACGGKTLSARELPVDLEEKFSDGTILAAKRITIPGHPHAFNPSIASWQGRPLLSFRILPNPKDVYTSEIGLMWLDDQYNPIGAPHILTTRYWPDKGPPRAEDARLLTVGERLYIFYDDNPREKVDRGGFRMYIAEVCWDGCAFSLKDIDRLVDFPNKSDNIREKSWVPFEYDGTPHLSYSIAPHVVFKPQLGSGRCESFCTSLSDMRWKWGVLRGGTQAMRLGADYLAFFHSSCDMESAHSDGKKVAHYFMGAYTFSSEPPFFITKMSRQPIVGSGFYNGQKYKPYWKPVKVVFPGGYVIHGGQIVLAYGRDDHEVWLALLDTEKLMGSLAPVASVHLQSVLKNKR